jgi:long-chain fatty acid transport protein
VGAGFSTVAELLGTVVAATDATGHVGTRVEDQLIAVYAPIFGVSYDLPIGKPRSWRVGATFRGTLAASFLVSLDGTKLTSLNIPVLNIGGLAQYDPAQVAIEGAYDSKTLLVALGLTPATIGYHDTVAIHVGADRPIPVSQTLTAHVRAGYFLEPTPLPSSLPSSTAYSPSTAGVVALPTRYYDATRHAITMGGGIDLSRRHGDGPAETPVVTLDLYGQLHLLQPRTMTYTPGPSGDPSTTSQASVGGHVLMAGMVVGAKF